jgi:hypothetical protein
MGGGSFQVQRATDSEGCQRGGFIKCPGPQAAGHRDRTHHRGHVGSIVPPKDRDHSDEGHKAEPDDDPETAPDSELRID